MLLSPVGAEDLAANSRARQKAVDELRQRAINFEKRGAWLEASRAWDEILRRDRTISYAREGYQSCLRRHHLAVRHADPLYRQTLGRLHSAHALDTYEQVLSVVSVAYPDRTKTSFASLFHQGLLELRIALDDPHFRRTYLPGVKPAALAAFKKRLASWSTSRIHTRSDAREEVLAVIRSAPRDGVPLRQELASTIVMEFAAGACNALDEHSSFLSPGNLAMIEAALRGKLVGVGLEVGLVGDRIRVTRVLDRSPAREEKVEPGDLILRVAGQRVEDLPAEAVAERLRGLAGSSVEIETKRGPNRRTLKLVRRAATLPSVERDRVGTLDFPAGYVRINHFQESTVQELRDALTSLTEPVPMAEPVKGLILDLRGNPGGLFKSAVAAAELFLPEGLIVIGQSPFKDYNQPFKVEAAGATLLPMVILIDGDTASAAEVLAAALRETRPGRATTILMGQTSFGKGSVQCMIPLEKAPLDKLAGIRLTVAKLFSPSGQTWTGRGITPDVFTSADGNKLIEEAIKELFQAKEFQPKMAPRMEPPRMEPTPMEPPGMMMTNPA